MYVQIYKFVLQGYSFIYVSIMQMFTNISLMKDHMYTTQSSSHKLLVHPTCGLQIIISTGQCVVSNMGWDKDICCGTHIEE